SSVDRRAGRPRRAAAEGAHHRGRHALRAAAHQRALPPRHLQPGGRGGRAHRGDPDHHRGDGRGRARRSIRHRGGGAGMTITGTQDEDRSNYTKEESRAIRQRSLRLLGSLIHPLRVRIVIAALVLVVSTALQVAGPIIIGIALDNALPQLLQTANWMPAVMVTVVYLLAGIFGSALIGVYVVLAARITQAVLLDLRKRIFLHTQRLSLEFHESYTSGRIISRQTSDLDSIRELLDGGLNNLVSGVLFGLFTFIALVIADWQAGIILLVAGVPLLLLMRWFYGRSQLVYRESRVISAKVIVQFVETMTGIRAVKSFRKEPRNDPSFRKVRGDY